MMAILRRRRHCSFLSTSLLIAAGLALLLLTGHSAMATDIKWTAASDGRSDNSGGKETAATAPRSKRYWIENNIEVPDYAKTDAELALERGETATSGLAVLLKTLAIVGVLGYIGYAVVLPRYQHGRGNRLGGGFSMSSLFGGNRHLEEEARKARLQRLDMSRFEAKDD